jgi:hypothetical protein
MKSLRLIGLGLEYKLYLQLVKIQKAWIKFFKTPLNPLKPTQ